MIQEFAILGRKRTMFSALFCFSIAIVGFVANDGIADRDCITIQFSTGNKEERLQAIERLAMQPTSPESISTVVIALEDPELQIRLRAFEYLCVRQVETRAAGLFLVREIKKPTSYVADNVFLLLRRLGKQAAPLISCLQGELAVTKNCQIKLRLVEAICISSPNEAEVDAILVNLMSSPTFAERVTASHLYMLRKGVADKPLGILIKGLESKDNEQQLHIVEILAELGEKAEKAIPHILHLVTRNNCLEVRLAAIDALGQIGRESKAVMPVLDRLMQDHNERIRRSAVTTIGHFPVDTNRLHRIELVMCHDTDRVVRLLAAMTVFKVSGKENALDVIRRFANEAEVDSEVRHAAIRILRDIASFRKEKS